MEELNNQIKELLEEQSQLDKDINSSKTLQGELFLKMKGLKDQLEIESKKEEAEKLRLSRVGKNFVYVVYWVDLDDDRVNKSEIDIIGVFSKEDRANHLAMSYEHKGYCSDERCYYTSVKELELNKVPDYIKQQIKDGF